MNRGIEGDRKEKAPIHLNELEEASLIRMKIYSENCDGRSTRGLT